MFFDIFDDSVIVYPYNILIFSRTKEEYFTALNKVFSHLTKFKLLLKESKCALFLKSVVFLSYIVSAEGLVCRKGKQQHFRTGHSLRTSLNYNSS